jgi:hypothetical protein
MCRASLRWQAKSDTKPRPARAGQLNLAILSLLKSCGSELQRKSIKQWWRLEVSVLGVGQR